MSPNLTQVDHANLSDKAARLLLAGQFPPMPILGGIAWNPPDQTPPVTQATTPGRMHIWANADSHDWQEMMNDVPGGDGAAAGQVMSYWGGGPAASYVMTLRSYWALVPGTYTRVAPGNTFTKSYSTKAGISETDATSISATLNANAAGLGATITAQFSHSVTTSSETQESTSFTVQGPAEGLTRVWMLWQLVDEICAIDPATNAVVSNETRRADVNWSEHAPSGAFVNYLNVHQHFPSETLVPLTQDFPTSA